MSSQEAVDRVLSTLTRELRASRRIGEIEKQIGRSRGYFSKVAAGKWRISIDLLMETLEALDLDPATFFAQAFAEDREGSPSGSAGRSADMSPASSPFRPHRAG